MNAAATRFVNPFIQHLRVFFSTAQARAVGLVFASDSLLFGSWVAHIPHVKQALRLTDGQLGLALFAMPAGLLTMNPLTGWLVGRLGQVRACFWAAIFLCLFITIPVAAPNVWVLAVALYGIGLCAALINVAMNTLATDVEKAHGITIMSASHGMWSVGGAGGFGGGGAGHCQPGAAPGSYAGHGRGGAPADAVDSARAANHPGVAAPQNHLVCAPQP